MITVNDGHYDHGGEGWTPSLTLDMCVCVSAAPGSAEPEPDRPSVLSARSPPHAAQTESTPPGVLFVLLHLLLVLGSQRGAAGQQ